MDPKTREELCIHLDAEKQQQYELARAMDDAMEAAILAGGPATEVMAANIAGTINRLLGQMLEGLAQRIAAGL